jgi:hypothetical protein
VVGAATQTWFALQPSVKRGVPRAKGTVAQCSTTVHVLPRPTPCVDAVGDGGRLDRRAQCAWSAESRGRTYRWGRLGGARLSKYTVGKIIHHIASTKIQ